MKFIESHLKRRENSFAFITFLPIKSFDTPIKQHNKALY